MHASRRDKLKKALKKQGLPGLLVTGDSNVVYLTGFTGGDSFLLLTDRDELLISDFRYLTQIEEECPGLRTDIRRAGGPTMAEQTAAAINRLGTANLGVEAGSLTLELRDSIAAHLKAVSLVSTTGVVEELRKVKDKVEIAAIRRAIALAEKAFTIVRATLRGDLTEKQVADDIEFQVRRLGGRSCSFTPIVAAGPRAALPHARSTTQPLDGAGFVLIDWGADEGLYKSDLTRVLVTGRIPPKLERVYGVVFTAQQRAIAAVRPGATGEEVDAAARAVIAKAGFGQNFGHGTGHGVGLDIHESPRLGPKHKDVLKAGMVITIEPGIYVPGQLGVRIEDDVLVTRSGGEVLTSVPKRWEDVFVA
ncbi:MAG: aminopeptidase P family protein [Planctomycetia bacterium]|nr:aminopeptidase P family protein [Planctomycetia bacterium]